MSGTTQRRQSVGMGVWTAWAALGLALAIAAAGCSTDQSTDTAGESAAPSTTMASTSTTVAPSPTTTEAPASSDDRPTIAVTAADFAFLGLPAEIEAGTALTLENQSDVELHELVAIRLPDDETRPVAELLQLPPDELAAFVPLVETVIIAEPSREGVPIEGTGVLREPGRYAIICAIPTGADPLAYLQAAAESEGGPPEVEGGPPHFVNGMFAEVTVTG